MYDGNGDRRYTIDGSSFFPYFDNDRSSRRFTTGSTEFSADPSGLNFVEVPLDESSDADSPYAAYLLFQHSDLADYLDTVTHDLEEYAKTVSDSALSKLVDELKKDRTHFVKHRLEILQRTYQARSAQMLQFCYIRLIKACAVLLQDNSLSKKKKDKLEKNQESFLHRANLILNECHLDPEMSQRVKLFSLQRDQFSEKTEEQLTDYRHVLSTQLLWKLSSAMQHRRFDRVMFLLDAYYGFYRSSFMFEKKGHEEILNSFFVDLQKSFKELPIKVQKRFSRGMVNLSGFETNVGIFIDATPWSNQHNAEQMSTRAHALLNILRATSSRLPVNERERKVIEKRDRNAPIYSTKEEMVAGYSRVSRKHKRMIWKALFTSPLEERKKILAEFESVSGQVATMPTKRRSHIRFLNPLLFLRMGVQFGHYLFPHKFIRKHFVGKTSVHRRSNRVR